MAYSLALALIALTILLAFPTSAPAKEKGWLIMLRLLSREHDKVIVTANGLTIQEGTVKTIIDARAKPKVVLMYPENKVFQDINFKDFQKDFDMHLKFQQGVKRVKIHKVGEEKVAGINCHHFKATNPDRNNELVYEFWAAPNITSQAVADCSNQMIGLPAGYGLSLRGVRWTKNYPYTEHTAESAKQIDVEASEFKVPKNFKKVDDLFQLVFSNEGRPMTEKDLEPYFFQQKMK